MKKIFYIANIRLPTEKAHGLAIMKMCESFASVGHDVELVVPKRVNPIKKDPFDYYEVSRNFQIKILPSIDVVWLGKTGFMLQWLLFAKLAAVYCVLKGADLYYGRDELSLWLISLFRKNVVWEPHNAKNNWVVRSLIKRCEATIPISRELKEYYMSLDAPEDRSCVVPSGVDLKAFNDIGGTKGELRQKLDLPQDKKIVAYVGKREAMGKSKGIGGIEEAFKTISDSMDGIFTMIVSDVHPTKVPAYMKASDVLVMNYPLDQYHHFMSPLKMFEYMASGVPIVTSDISTIREILDESMAYFFEPDDLNDLARTVERVFSEYNKAEEKAELALEKVRNFSWEKRSETILSFINRKNFS